MSDNDKRGGDTPNTGVLVKARAKTRKPAMYKVLMLNDDYTPMEFVVHVLERFFQKTREEATRIMLHVHRRGVGVCGVFTYEVAETKVTQVMDLAAKTSTRCNAPSRKSSARLIRDRAPTKGRGLSLTKPYPSRGRKAKPS